MKSLRSFLEYHEYLGIWEQPVSHNIHLRAPRSAVLLASSPGQSRLLFFAFMVLDNVAGK